LWVAGWLAAFVGCSQPKLVATDIPREVAKAEPRDEAATTEPTESPSSGAKSEAPASGTAEASVPEPATPPPASSEQAKGQRPRADRTKARPGEAEKITFDDLNLGMQADVVFREFMVSENDRVKDLEGKRVSIVGFIHGAPDSRVGIKKFILLKNTQCKFGPGGQADHLTDVVLRQGTTTNYTTSDITVEGTLRIEPFQGNDGNTWSIYRLEDAQVR
jgi:hypothetical protein